MEETFAELQRQLKEQQKLLEEAERRREEAERRREEAERRQEEERQAREKAERLLENTTLYQLLDHCHKSLSREIRVETNAKLTTQGDATDPVKRLYPKRIIPWHNFPQLQEQIWERLDRAAAFTSRPLFASVSQIDYVAMTIRNKPIYSEASLRIFERETVDNFVERIIEALRDDESLQHEFGIRGEVRLYDRANPAETSLESSLDRMRLQDARSPARPVNARRGRSGGRSRGRRARPAQSQTKADPARRRNRRADQFCVHVVAGEQQKSVYAVEFKAPHKVTIPELVAGLHEMDLERDIIDQNGDTFDFHASRLVAAVVTQIFSYMIDIGVQYGYICTGQAFVFLHIPKNPTEIQYYLCVPNEDEEADADDDECRLHRTAIGQVLAFTLQALAAERQSHEWQNMALEKLTTWKVEYLDVLRDIPETIRKSPPASNYRPSNWKPYAKKHNTRSQAGCNPGTFTPKPPSNEGSDGDEESPSPSAKAAARSHTGHGRGNNHQSSGAHGSRQSGLDSRKDKQTSRPYCTMACIRGMATGGPLDTQCPNLQRHMESSHGPKHCIGPQEFTRRLHRQLVGNPDEGFEPLDIRGRTGFLVKATLLTHGYTVIIKATTAEKQHFLLAEVDNYRHLRSLQGQQIPVCVGSFEPRVRYWYHGKLMARMMILSWSGMRLQQMINDENYGFFDHERRKALAVLKSHGVVHGDSEWRNMLWDELSGRLVVIDLEDMKWLKRPRALAPTSGNTQRGHRAGAAKSRQMLPLSRSTARCT